MVRRGSLRWFASTLAMGLACAGCSGDDTSSSSPKSDADSLNGCSSYSPGKEVQWGLSAKAPTTCLQVKKGESVTWVGDFSHHPLSPYGGDVGNPVSTVSSGNAPKSFKFDAVGKFGFVCDIHPSMTGAIQVVD